MYTPKQAALDFIHTLPESADTLDILESLLVKQQIEKGLADAESGRVISNDELQNRLALWRQSNGH